MKEILMLDAPEFSRSEMMRYARVGDDGRELPDINKLIAEAAPVLNYKLSYCKLKFTLDDDICDFGDITLRSHSLAAALSGSSEAVLFVATVGIGLDRLIAKYSHTSPYLASMLHAYGTERVEALADAFCKRIEGESPYGITRRFSPGYGDLSLEVQRDIFKLLSPERDIGVYLNESLFMTPSKSVTAFFGIRK